VVLNDGVVIALGFLDPGIGLSRRIGGLGRKTEKGKAECRNNEQCAATNGRKSDHAALPGGRFEDAGKCSVPRLPQACGRCPCQLPGETGEPNSVRSRVERRRKPG